MKNKIVSNRQQVNNAFILSSWIHINKKDALEQQYLQVLELLKQNPDNEELNALKSEMLEVINLTNSINQTQQAIQGSFFKFEAFQFVIFLCSTPFHPFANFFFSFCMKQKPNFFLFLKETKLQTKALPLTNSLHWLWTFSRTIPNPKRKNKSSTKNQIKNNYQNNQNQSEGVDLEIRFGFLQRCEFVQQDRDDRKQESRRFSASSLGCRNQVTLWKQDRNRISLDRSWTLKVGDFCDIFNKLCVQFHIRKAVLWRRYLSGSTDFNFVLIEYLIVFFFFFFFQIRSISICYFPLLNSISCLCKFFFFILHETNNQTFFCF